MSLRDPYLETPRLVLRPIRLEDFEGWAALMADEEAARFIGGRQPRWVAWRVFLAVAGAWRTQGFGIFSVLEKASLRWIGRVGLWCPPGWPGNEISWSLRRDAWGRGYATEAAAATLEWAFEQVGWQDVIHCIAPANVASQRVAIKLGSRNHGRVQLPPPHEETVVDGWGQSRKRWRGSAERARLLAGR